MCCSPYTSCSQATLGIFRTEGVRAFYRSYFTQLTMNVPFQAAMVTSYSVCQAVLNPDKEYNPYVHFLAGALAGGVGSAVTMPLDVCKTLLNTQEANVLKQLRQTEVSTEHSPSKTRFFVPAYSLSFVVISFAGGWPVGGSAERSPGHRLSGLLPGSDGQVCALLNLFLAPF